MSSLLSGIYKLYSSSTNHDRIDDNHGGNTRNIHMSSTSIFMDGMTISLSIFSISAICFVKHIALQQHRRSTIENIPFYQRRRKSLRDLCVFHDDEETNLENRSHNSGYNDTSKNSSSMSSTIEMMISNRGKTALLPVIPIRQQFFTALRVRIYHSFSLDIED